MTNEPATETTLSKEAPSAGLQEEPPAPSKVWEKYGTSRGTMIEDYMAKLFKRIGQIRRLPKNFKSGDFIAGGKSKVIRDASGRWAGEVIEEATLISEKSIDLRGKSVQTSQGTYGRLRKYVNSLIDFNKYKLKGIEVINPREKVLNIRYGPGDPSPAQVHGLKRIIQYCSDNGIIVNIQKFR